MYIGVIMARLRSVGISPVFREALYSSWRGWARLLLHCLRSIAGNSSGTPEEFWKIVFIASMMSSLNNNNNMNSVIKWICVFIIKVLIGELRKHKSLKAGSIKVTIIIHYQK